jgi:hypothetical protein
MTQDELFGALVNARSVADVESAIEHFSMEHEAGVAWVPLGGRENNRGPVEVSGDPGRALVERITNGIDAVLEAEHDSHHGVPECRSPKEAATAWLNIPSEGISKMTPAQRQALARRVVVRLGAGESKQSRVVEVRDFGTGIRPGEMATSILSLNASNKLQKHYLVGTYGQGGSSTLVVSRYTVIASRAALSSAVGFTVAKYREMPPDLFKTGHYAYLTLNSGVFEATVPSDEFPRGTLVRHLGYDLSGYGSPLGPGSIYGLLNQTLFDPVMPVWLDSELHGYRRVIKGSRNALNGAVDEGDPDRRGPDLAHHMPMFHVVLDEFGSVGIEYWVLQRPSKKNKRPTAAFVNPARPIVLTLHGQTHHEVSGIIIRREAELPYLAQRLICHVDCNSLAPFGKRVLFPSSREAARRGLLLERIEREIAKAFRSDDDLVRLNDEAKSESHQEQDAAVREQMRSEVAKILRIHGLELGQPTAGLGGGPGAGREKPTRPRRQRPTPEPIEPHDPPTFVDLLWDTDRPITFFPGQRRYLRIKTDAPGSYHNPDDPSRSRLNFISSTPNLVFRGSTPLVGGRMRVVVEATTAATVGETGTITVEISRPGLQSLSDRHNTQVVPMPPARPTSVQMAVPDFDVRPVNPDDDMWEELGWPADVAKIASATVMENGKLVVYYSTAYPRYASQRSQLEQKDTVLAGSFEQRYKTWLAVHSLLYYQDQRDAEAGKTGEPAGQSSTDLEAIEAREREERCRIATMVALVAAREVARPSDPDEET